MPLPKVATKAPAFSAPDENGKTWKLSDFSGSWLLLYFYPKDDTPGCTIEACTIRDQFKDFKKIGASVVGVSKDSVQSHKKFKDAYELPFTLLSDEELNMNKAYGVWEKKSMLGKTYMGTKRTSFLIDPKGKIAKVYENVKPPTHARQVIEDLKTLIA
jgi:peroxiredoxin Q/BCP